MGMFGWSYPPGCNSVPGDEDEGPCEVCGQMIDNCLCPECPECGEQGNPDCYEHHGLVRTEAQIESLKQKEKEWEEWLKAENEAYGYPEEDLFDETHDESSETDGLCGVEVRERRENRKVESRTDR